jgi:hypothetical protein
MRVETLYEFIVPLIFIMIWAVTWILNREAQALPPRSATREPNDQAAMNRVRSGASSRDLRDPRAPSNSPRTGRSMPPEREREKVPGPGDAIIFTEPELDGPAGPFERPSSTQRPARAGQNRRPARSRGAATKPRPRVAPEKTRELTQDISNSMAGLKGKPLTLTPLNLPLSPLSSLSLTTTTLTDLSAVAPTSGLSNSAISLLDFHKAVADPARLRELFVWNELIQPPLALRQDPYRRR